MISINRNNPFLPIRNLATIAALAVAGAASAAPPFPVGPGHAPVAPGLNRLQCFDGTTDGGYGGVCTLVGKGARKSATLDNSDANANGDYAGVYAPRNVLTGRPLTGITQLGYTYTGTIAPQPGNLSLNIPIDTNGDGTTEAYAFIDAYYCPGVDGVVDVINDPNCGIYYNGQTFYANWSAFIASYPDARVATDNTTIIVAERTPTEPAATWTISNVVFGRPGGAETETESESESE